MALSATKGGGKIRAPGARSARKPGGSKIKIAKNPLSQKKLGNRWNTVSRALFQKRAHWVLQQLGEFYEKLGEFDLPHNQ